MAEPVNGNGYKALIAAAALGLLTGGASTYTVAEDYAETVCSLRIENAVNADRISRVEQRLDDKK